MRQSGRSSISNPILKIHLIARIMQRQPTKHPKAPVCDWRISSGALESSENGKVVFAKV
jgi:hypothetical protein